MESLLLDTATKLERMVRQGNSVSNIHSMGVGRRISLSDQQQELASVLCAPLVFSPVCNTQLPLSLTPSPVQ